MARNDYAHMRLKMWALWCARNRGGGQYATATLAERVDCAGWDAPAVISNIDAEAEETDRAVRALDATLRETVVVYYQSGRGIERRAARLGVSVATMYGRVDLATHVVARWLADKQRAAAAERARVEGLQRRAVDRRQSFHR
jgi:hypothetical protein